MFTRGLFTLFIFRVFTLAGYKVFTRGVFSLEVSRVFSLSGGDTLFGHIIGSFRPPYRVFTCQGFTLSNPGFIALDTWGAKIVENCLACSAKIVLK